MDLEGVSAKDGPQHESSGRSPQILSIREGQLIVDSHPHGGRTQTEALLDFEHGLW